MADVYATKISETKSVKEEDTGQRKEQVAEEISQASADIEKNTNGCATAPFVNTSGNPFHSPGSAVMMNVTPPNPFASRPSDVVSSPHMTEHGSDERARVTVRSSILAPAKMGLGNQADVQPNPSKVLLRPSALAAHVVNLAHKDGQTGQAPVLKPAKLQDPGFGKDTKESEEKEKENKELVLLKDAKDKHVDNNLPVSDNCFMPESHCNDTLKLPKESTGKKLEKPDVGADFVFGQKLAERVADVPTSPGSEKFVFGENLADRVVQSKKGLSKEFDDDDSSEEQTSPEKTMNQTLEESAREFQAKHDRKPDLKEVEVKTGEEDESNVLQANCKLFMFDASDETWIERGRGLLRLNDMSSPSSSTFQSRLVMRTHGCLRVILNTKIWPGMTAERASQKSVRIIATDGIDGVKVFLIQTNPKDCENILRAVEWRIQKLRVSEEAHKEQTKGSEKRKADTDSPPEEVVTKKSKKSDDSTGVVTFKKEESDSSVLDPETDASSESYTSSVTVRSESD